MSGGARFAKKVMDVHETPARSLIGRKNSEMIHGRSIFSPIDDAVAKEDKAKAKAKTAEQRAEEVRAAQRTQLAELDDEENRRIKKLITGSRGTRNYRGGPMFRTRASNTAGAPRAAAGAASSAPATAMLRDAGRRGGLRYGGENVSLL